MTATWPRRRAIAKRGLTQAAAYLVVGAFVLFAVFPVYWMISTSFKPDTQWFAWPPFYFPHPPTLSNYLNVWFGAEEYTATQYAISSQKPLISLFNSTIIAGTATLLSVLFGSVMAYGVSRWRAVFEIVLPLIRSGLVAPFLSILILTWSEYLLALLITKTQVTTLPI